MLRMQQVRSKHVPRPNQSNDGLESSTATIRTWTCTNTTFYTNTHSTNIVYGSRLYFTVNRTPSTYILILKGTPILVAGAECSKLIPTVFSQFTSNIDHKGCGKAASTSRQTHEYLPNCRPSPSQPRPVPV